MIRIFAVLCVTFVLVLAVVPTKSHFREWREEQDRYNAAATRAGQSPVAVKLQQIWNPALGVVDRCPSCHVASAGAAEVAGDRLFKAHPKIPHDPARFGCTLCHGGQGRATRADAAHGTVKHWFEPVLGRDHLEAGCGSCHSALPVGALETVERGARLFERYDCLACHAVNGRGGTQVAPLTFPDLSGIGLKGVPDDWHRRHLERQAQNPSGPFRDRYGPLPAEDVGAVGEYLRTLVAAPRLSEGKRLFHVHGCRGCHKVGGVGGDDGADLTLIGKRPLEDYAFPRGWRGERTIVRWHVEHLLSPASVVPGSTMPRSGLTRAEAEAITLYLLSLRKADIPADYWPPDRLRVEKLGERDFGTDGRSLYLVFCAACHGPDGLGRRFGEFAQAFPGIATRAFLSVASDDFLAQSLAAGRPGRRMPAWGRVEGGLRPAEIENLVRYLRSCEPVPPDYRAVAAAEPDPALGRSTYLGECGTCHGTRGEGAIGPSLRSPVFQALSDDRFLYETLVTGRPGTAMPRHRDLDARTLASVIAHVRSLADGRVSRVDLDAIPLPPASADRGRLAWARSCAACRGAAAEGGLGPAVGKRGFFRAATEAYVVESYARGRCRTEDGKSTPPVDRQTLADIAAHLRAEASRPGVRLEGRRVKGDRAEGGRLFGRFCASCHGAKAEGKEAPALANPAFLEAANDGFLQAMIVRGRHGTSMPRFDRDQPTFPRLSAAEIDGIVAFLRSLESAKPSERK